jgi:hypothetical protein
MCHLSLREVLRMLSPTCLISEQKSLEEGGRPGRGFRPPNHAGWRGGGWPQAALNGEDFAVQLQGLHGKIVVICE